MLTQSLSRVETLSIQPQNAFLDPLATRTVYYSRDRFMCHVVSERQQFLVCHTTNSQLGVARTSTFHGFCWLRRQLNSMFLNQSQLSFPLVCRTLSCYRVSCPSCCGSNVWLTLRRCWSRLSRQRQNDPERALRSATLELWFPASDASRRRDTWWRSPVPWGDNTQGELFYLFRQPSRVGPADWSRTS